MTDYRKALLALIDAVGKHPDARVSTGDLHTPFMRACDVVLNEEPLPEVAPTITPVDIVNIGDRAAWLVINGEKVYIAPDEKYRAPFSPQRTIVGFDACSCGMTSTQHNVVGCDEVGCPMNNYRREGK